MATYKEEADKARKEFLTGLKHRIIMDLLDAGLSDSEISYLFGSGLSRQLVGYVKKKRSKLIELNNQSNGSEQ